MLVWSDGDTNHGSRGAGQVCRVSSTPTTDGTTRQPRGRSGLPGLLHRDRRHHTAAAGQVRSAGSPPHQHRRHHTAAAGLVRSPPQRPTAPHGSRGAGQVCWVSSTQGLTAPHSSRGAGQVCWVSSTQGLTAPHSSRGAGQVCWVSSTQGPTAPHGSRGGRGRPGHSLMACLVVALFICGKWRKINRHVMECDHPFS